MFHVHFQSSVFLLWSFIYCLYVCIVVYAAFQVNKVVYINYNSVERVCMRV